MEIIVIRSRVESGNFKGSWKGRDEHRRSPLKKNGYSLTIAHIRQFSLVQPWLLMLVLSTQLGNTKGSLLDLAPVQLHVEVSTSWGIPPQDDWKNRMRHETLNESAENCSSLCSYLMPIPRSYWNISPVRPSDLGLNEGLDWHDTWISKYRSRITMFNEMNVYFHRLFLHRPFRKNKGHGFAYNLS